MNSKNKTSSSNMGYIFLSGAGLGSWVWKDVMASLKQPSVGVNYPKDPNVGIEEYAQAAIDQIKDLSVEKMVVVSHSLGGVVGLKVAEALGERLAGFVAISAAIPKNGGSFFSSLPFPQKMIMPLIMKLAGTKPPEAALRKGYCNDLSVEQTAEVLKRYAAESAKIYSDSSTLPPSSVPKLYIKTTNDNEFSDTLQNIMQRNLGADKIVTINSGHLPMLSKPEELAGLLDDFVRDFRLR